MACPCCGPKKSWACYQCCCPDGSKPKDTITATFVRAADSEVSVPTIEGSYVMNLGSGGPPWYFKNSPIGALARASCVRYEYNANLEVPFEPVTYTHYFRGFRGNFISYSSTGSNGLRIGFHMDYDGTFVFALEYSGVKDDPDAPAGDGKYSLRADSQFYLSPLAGAQHLCESPQGVIVRAGFGKEGGGASQGVFVLSIS